MKKLALIVLSLTFFAAWTASSPQMDYENWKAVDPISPEFGNSEELVERFSHWPNYKGTYDIMGGAKAALRWCKTEASNNYEFRKGNYDPEDRRNYGFVTRPNADGAPRMAPSDPQWVKDCTECMEALGFEFSAPEKR